MIPLATVTAGICLATAVLLALVTFANRDTTRPLLRWPSRPDFWLWLLLELAPCAGLVLAIAVLRG
jgi:hypothetical protein